MSLDPRRTASLALHRFGFGPRLGSIAEIAADPRGALSAELDRPAATVIGGGTLLGSAEAVRRSYDDIMARRTARFSGIVKQVEREKRQQATRGSMAAAVSETDTAETRAGRPAPPSRRRNDSSGPQLARTINLEEAKARSEMALASQIGFLERLVWFWSNHFCIATKKVNMRAIAGAYEREAIRQHVCGRFVDMLLAVESHPAMLLYLDNVKSVGPNSRGGRRRGSGLNENLAREILELHTLGVRTAYTQEDVTNFAKVITGWSYIRPLDSTARGGEFEFVADWHEPGPKTVVGKTYPDSGVEQGRALLKDLAKHPATARHVAAKLATHFVADKPPDSLIDRLARRFLDTDGNLKEVAKSLVNSDEAWEAPRKKMKRPSEWIMGSLRAAEAANVDAAAILQAQEVLGEPLWRPPSPKGFSDQSAEWISGLGERVDVAANFARQASTLKGPPDLLEQALGPLASADTRSTIVRAEDRTQALTLLFMAPEFLLR